MTELNAEPQTVQGFGEEWHRFQQDALSSEEREQIFHDYFDLFPWDGLQDQTGVDIGCGSGRWAQLVAPRVGRLHVVDASDVALRVAKKNLLSLPKPDSFEFHHASVGQLPFSAGSLGFAYSLGVLHHVPDTEHAIREIARVLKPGAPFLLYLYYRFDNRPLWFRALWRASDSLRSFISKMPTRLRFWICDALAATLYWPLASLARWGERLGQNVNGWPLSYYRDKSFYVMRTDSLDRFGTRLEQRFTKAEIRAMLERSGFQEIQFSDHSPYWVAVSRKAPPGGR